MSNRETAQKNRGRLRRALKLAFPYRMVIVGILCLTLLLATINAVEPLVLKYIFDDLATNRVLHNLLVGIAILAGLGIVRELATALSNWMSWHTRLGLHYTVLESTVERIHRMPLSFHKDEGVGAIMTKLDRSVQGLINALSQILFSVCPAILYLVISLGIMLYLNWKLAILVLAFLPLPAAIAALAGPEQNRRERALLDRWSKTYSRFNEVLSGMITVRSFSMEDSEKRRFMANVEEANRIVIRGVGIDSGVGAATNLVVTAARIAAIAFGGIMIIHGNLTLGSLIAFLGYVGGLFGPVQGLTGIFQTIQKAYVSLDEIFSILDEQDHLGDAPDAKDLVRPKGDVVFSGVKFHYEEPSRPVLRGIDLKAEPGKTLAVVGPSGSGKTTLMALLMRFYDPEEGSVSIDGYDLRTLKQRSLRKNIGTVLQDPLLFNDTVRNNIAYGRPDATPAEIEAAARMANAHNFISQLPDGYETMAGERGGRFSLGERQRIAIARALVKNPPILILDEVTASLDAETEALVQDALKRLMKGRTTFVIAHRLSTVVNADRIIVLKHGLIAESGKHSELMKRGGYYASLVKQQTSGLIINEGEEQSH